MIEPYNGRQVMNAIEEVAHGFRYPNGGTHAMPHRVEVYVELEDGTTRPVTTYRSGFRAFPNQRGDIIHRPCIFLYAGETGGEDQ
jgi:hypothetical protein